MEPRPAKAAPAEFRGLRQRQSQHIVFAQNAEATTEKNDWNAASHRSTRQETSKITWVAAQSFCTGIMSFPRMSALTSRM